MRHLFYIIIILPILWEMMSITSPKKIINFMKTYKGLKWDDYSSSQKTLATLNFGYLAWGFVGLFTFQWPAFLLLFIISLMPGGKLWFLRIINGLICFFILLFILLNNYQFHYDLSSYILNLLK